MLDVIVLGNGISGSGDSGLAELCLGLILKRYDVGNTCRKFVRSAHFGDTTHVVNLGLVVEIVQVAAFKSDAVTVIKITGLTAVAPRIVDTLDVHVHFRLVTLLVPHAQPCGICRESLLRDVAIAVIFVIRYSYTTAELL